MQFHNSFWLCSCLVSDISESVSGIIMMTQRLRSLLLFQRLYGWIFHRVAGDVIRNDPSNYRSGPCSTECHRLTDRTTGTWYLCRRSPPTHSASPPERASKRMIAGHVTDILKTTDGRSRRPADIKAAATRPEQSGDRQRSVRSNDSTQSVTRLALVCCSPPLKRPSFLDVPSSVDVVTWRSVANAWRHMWRRSRLKVQRQIGKHQSTSVTDEDLSVGIIQSNRSPLYALR